MLLREFKQKLRGMKSDYELDNLCLEWLDAVARDRGDAHGRIACRLLTCLAELLLPGSGDGPPEPPGNNNDNKRKKYNDNRG